MSLSLVTRAAGLSAAALLLHAVADAGDDWPRFRGPTGQGVSDATGLPVAWSESKNIAWKTPLAGVGWSSPVIADGRVWLTAARATMRSEAEMQRLRETKYADYGSTKGLVMASRVDFDVLAVDAATGEIVHEKTLFTALDPAPKHNLNSYASPTPVLFEGDRVVCHFGTYGTACLDTDTAEVVWTRRLECDHSVGPGSSPLYAEGLIVIPCDGVDTQYVEALYWETGVTVWKTPRPPMGGDNFEKFKAFSTPLLIPRGPGRGRGRELVITTAQWVCAYDVPTGTELWRVSTDLDFSTVPTPVFHDGLVYAATGFPRPRLFAIDPTGSGDVTASRVAWRATSQVPKMPSPVVAPAAGREAAVWLAGDKGVVTALDPATGENLDRFRLSGNFVASPLYADGRLYISNRDATTYVLDPATGDVLAENDLDGEQLASLAVADGAFFIRTDGFLYRVSK
ncbi:MAG: PQQ-binding-like beta-propeller repeat protein [Planctomycetota bacterium]